MERFTQLLKHRIHLDANRLPFPCPEQLHDRGAMSPDELPVEAPVGWIARLCPPRAIEEQIRHPLKGGDNNDHALLVCAVEDDPRNLSDAAGRRERRPAKLHDFHTNRSRFLPNRSVIVLVVATYPSFPDVLEIGSA